MTIYFRNYVPAHDVEVTLYLVLIIISYYMALLNASECSIHLNGLPNVRRSIIFV